MESTLFQYEDPKWKLPAASDDSLQAQALLKFCHHKFQTKKWNNDSLCPSSHLPLLVLKGERRRRREEEEEKGEEEEEEERVVQGVEKIRQYLIERYGAILRERGEEDLAFCSLVQGKLKQILWFNWFQEPQNYQILKNTLFKEEFGGFPINRFASSKKMGEMETTLKVCGLVDREEVYQEAEKYYSCLEAKLTKSRYFGGPSPNALDAVVFGHLAIALYSPLPVNQLSSIIRKKPRLLTFVEQILFQFWNLKLDLPEEYDENSEREEKSETHVKTAIMFGIGLFAVFLVSTDVPQRIIKKFY